MAAKAAVARLPRSFSVTGITLTRIPLRASNSLAIACCLARRSGCSSVVQNRSVCAWVAKTVVAARVNGHVVDLSRALDTDSEVEPIGAASEDGVDVLRHSTAHLMAQAVKRLFPDVQVTIGPTIGPTTTPGA